MKFVFTVCFFCLAAISHAQSPSLSEQSTISLITLGPDQDDLVQAFGHSAVRVFDPAGGIDVAFNYGVFSFNQPNFYLNFARGHNLYYLGIASYPEFKEAYIYYNRNVHEQILNLTLDQRQKIFEYLQWNARAENREYLYDYFFNNCSTKIRDVLKDVLKEEIQFDSTPPVPPRTIRQLTDPYLKFLPWGDLGIDIGLGSPIDKEATAYQSTYLPEYLESAFDHALVKRAGTDLPLVKEKIIVYQAKPMPPKKSLIHPWMAFGTLFFVALTLTILDFRRKKISLWFDAVWLITLGLVGVVLFLLWTATDHHACARNLNLAWAIPTHLVVVFFVFKKHRPIWVTRYFQIVAAISLLLLVLWPVLPQLLNPFLIPVVGTALLRSTILFRQPSQEG